MKLIFFRKTIFSALTGAVISLLLLVLFSAILSGQDDPSKLMGVFSAVSLAVGAFVSGKLSVIGLEKRLLQGVACGMALVLMILMPSVIISDFSSWSLLKMLLTVVLAVAGAMIGRKNVKSLASSRRRKSVIKRYSR